MKKLIATIAAIAAITISAHARIGETLDEATLRYGIATQLGEDGWRMFHKGNFQINVQFYQGKIDKIEYLKVKASGGTVELSEVEVNNFLKANYNGTWETSTYRQWYTPYLSAPLYACQSYHVVEKGTSYYRLIICTAEALDRFMRRVATDETAAQAGF